MEHLNDFLIVLSIVLPVIGLIVVAFIKRPKSNAKPLNSNFTNLQCEVNDLKDDLERQHIKIDDISERLAWLEGRNDKR